ncbi:MAG: helix-turn-helix transcriptional regulator [Bacteroidota bacterium]
MASKYWNRISETISPVSRSFTKKSLDIIDQVHYLLDERNMTQKDLALRLEKSESEISKWLSGGHNITLKTIVKLELALGASILETPLLMNSEDTVEEHEQDTNIKQPDNQSLSQ